MPFYWERQSPGLARLHRIGELVRANQYRAGRGGRDEYNETLAPAEADHELQGYNFRLIMTRDEANRVAPSMPTGYRRELFVGVLPLLEAGRIKKVFRCAP